MYVSVINSDFVLVLQHQLIVRKTRTSTVMQMDLRTSLSLQWKHSCT